MTKYIFIFLILLLQYTNAFAGSFRPLSIKEGLSSRQVFQISKDSAGFVWAYTHIGIDRYDGNEIRHYQLCGQVDSKDHIQSSTVMICDRTGRLWVALKNGKIYAYDYKTDSFLLRVDLATSFPTAAIYNILPHAAGHLWISMSTGIYSWDEEKGLLPAALKGHFVTSLIQVDGETFFAGTNKGIYQLRKDAGRYTFTAKPVPLPVQSHVECLYHCGNKLFAGTFSDGVFVIDRQTNEVRSLDHLVPHVPIRTFAEAKDNALLIGADGAGVFSIDRTTEKLLCHYMANEDDEKSLNGNTVSDICVDEHNGIWISTSTNGISYLAPEMPDVRRIRHERNHANSLKSDHINVLFQDSEGDSWYGTNNGISLYQPRQDKWTHYLDGTGHGGKVVLALAEDAKGNIWAGGYGIGVYCIGKKTGRVQKMPKRSRHAGQGIATDYIYSIYCEGHNLWMGGIEGEFTRYNMPADAYSYYPIDCIGDIKPGADGTLLLAGCNGLAFFDKATGKTTWRREFGNFILHYPIRCLLQSAAGDIWMATDGEGLVRYNPDTDEARVYTTHDGLSSNSVNSLLEDADGRIWVSTEKELYYLDSTRDMLIGVNDFLDSTWGYYNPNAALRLADGSLAFGTAEGVVTFLPSLNFEQCDPIRLIFTDFKLLYESVKAGMEGSLLQTNIDDTQQISLKYNQNSFSLSFSAIHFTAPHRVRYEYMLAGYSKEWEACNSVRSVNYMNLSPGKYVFCLRAFDKYTGKQIGERNLQIVIHAPYWISWWALLAYFVLLSVFIYMFMQYRRHKANEQKVNEKIRSFISIAHDIRTPVSLIKAPLSELEAQQELPEASRKSVAVAAKNAEKLLAMITQLLDFQKTELHAECLKVAQYDIKDYLEEKIAEFHLAAMQKGVELKLEVEPGIPAVWIDREKMDHIIDNLISNALKYTEKGAIYILVTTNKKKWAVEVRDTGIGIPKEEQRHIFHEYYRAQNAMNYGESGSGIGLMITRRLVKQHHGSISFSSAEGRGTSFCVVFPQKIKRAAVVQHKAQNRLMPVPTDAPGDAGRTDDRNVLLLAEDDPDMRAYLTDSLSAEYKVVSVADGGKALEMAREMNPDLIISDVIMPVIEGDELCRILKSSVDTSHIPIILLTALSERENIIFGLEAGAADYIIKPFDLSVLKVRIRNILQSRQHLRDTVLAMESRPEEADYASQLDKEFLDRMMEVVQQQMANSEFAINDFCRMLGMSRTSVYNKIKTLTGQGPNDFIRIVRLNKAKELLLSQKYSIGEVSVMVGFSDPKYFSTCFKKQFNVSPSKI